MLITESRPIILEPGSNDGLTRLVTVIGSNIRNFSRWPYISCSLRYEFGEVAEKEWKFYFRVE